MKLLLSQGRYRIADGKVKIQDKFEPDLYEIKYDFDHKQHFIEKSSVELTTDKVYGSTIQPRLTKVFKTWDFTQRNLGVLMSGTKGSGKSFFSRLLMKTAIEKGYPVFLVNQNSPGLPNFMNEIGQECVFMFDEFEKTFGAISFQDNSRWGGEDKVHTFGSKQYTLLSVFDGLGSAFKRLFIITCNEVNQLDRNLVNRPGRFLYHFKFPYVSPDDIETYLKDNLNKKYWEEIPSVIRFSKMAMGLTYDCLRAISIELAQGNKFAAALNDLNLLPPGTTSFTATVTFANGKTCSMDTYIGLKYILNRNENNKARSRIDLRDGEDFLGTISIPLNKFTFLESSETYVLDSDAIPLFTPRNSPGPGMFNFRRSEPVPQPQQANNEWVITKIELKPVGEVSDGFNFE